MPNWCANHLTITAEPPVITALLAKAKGKPSPDSDEEVPFSYLPFVQENLEACTQYAGCWSQCMLTLVGCKWFPDIDPELLSIEPDALEVSFDSPWGPPLEGTRAMATWLRAQGFAFWLELTYEESGCAFCGVLTIDDTREDDLCGEYAQIEEATLREGTAEDYADLCASFGISFADLQALATEDRAYVTLCPDFYRKYA